MAERTYSFKDVDMLISAKTLCNNFRDHKTDIVALRSTWADPFIDNFETRIDDAISNYLGLDPKKDLKLATQEVLTIQANAMRDIALFKVNLQADYATDTIRLNWLLDTFGFTAHLTDAQNQDQEALVELLQKFKLNMTADLKTEITGKGTSGTLIDDIVSYADPLKDANVAQEALKGSSKELTDEALNEFNEIYAQAIAIGKITSKLYKSDKVKREKFTFTKLVGDLNIRKGPQPEPPPDPQPLP